MTRTLPTTPAEPRPLEAHLAAYEAFERSATETSPPWLRALRTSGISYFAELGFPTTEHEEWRFTNAAPLAQFPFKPVHRALRNAVTAADLARITFGGLRACRLVFVDGHFDMALSELLPHSTGAVMGSLAAAIERRGDLVEARLGRAAHHESNAFAALNTAFIQDGAFIHVPPRAVLEAPIHLLFIATKPGTVNQPRNLIIAEERSQVRVIEDYVSLAGSAYFTNAVTEIFTGQDAAIEHLKIQREGTAAFHVATIEAHHQRQSRVLSHSISLGARFARNDINLRLDGEGCESVLNGLFLATGDQVVDHHTIADHARPHCASHEFYHGILGGRAKGVFNGKIYVRKDAQKTDAKQTNKNLLLSDEASINTKPQLEIFADDVKCTHGATVGQLDDQAIFYLRSRGIGEELARQMLIKAFASTVLNRITVEPVREELERLLEERLAQPNA
ncbi:MAG: Fe-S cluster assembly protein SufD [Verrucomicrobia bacterium]|nr:Fe-S cluster assembly protein SufD [Verrucomicrobiota bacterium]